MCETVRHHLEQIIKENNPKQNSFDIKDFLTIALGKYDLRGEIRKLMYQYWRFKEEHVYQSKCIEKEFLFKAKSLTVAM